MRRLFRKRKTKIILSIALTLSILAVIFSTVTDLPSPQSIITSAVINPAQKFAATIGDFFSGIADGFEDTKALQEENKALKDEINKLTKEAIDYENVVKENEFYKKYLEIKDTHSDYTMQPAMVITRDNTDPYGTFSVNAGLGDGVSLYDPVITDLGLVGYITEVTASQSVVMTLLDPKINITASDNRTRDSGNVTGDPAYVGDGCCVLQYLPKGNAVASGDYIITSGAGGIFPEGHLVGTVKSVRQNTGDLTAFAVVEPAVSVKDVTEVMIITSFQGQGALTE